MAKKKFFAISKGRRTGVFRGEWEQFKPYVNGFSGAIYKSFLNENDANAFFLANGGQFKNDAEHAAPSAAPPAKRAKVAVQPPRFAPPGTSIPQPSQQQPSSTSELRPAAAAAAAAAATTAAAGAGAAAAAAASTTAGGGRAATKRMATPASSSRGGAAAASAGDDDGTGVLSGDDQLFLVEFDGASKGNPGPAGSGALVRASTSGEIILRATLRLQDTTNNVAEYQGLILGLKEAARLGARNVQAIGDSNLVVCQVKGTWRVNKPHLAPLREEAAALAASFESFDIKHVLREYNVDADALSNEAISHGTSRTLLLRS